MRNFTHRFAKFKTEVLWQILKYGNFDPARLPDSSDYEEGSRLHYAMVFAEAMGMRQANVKYMVNHIKKERRQYKRRQTHRHQGRQLPP